MRRRELLLGLAGALAASRAHAQQKPPVVVILDPRAANPLAVEQVRDGLASLGFRDGQNVAVEFRGGGGDYGRMPALAAETVRDGASVIVAVSGASIHAAETATASIPIVFIIGFDPVKMGFVASLGKPGGNATGLSMLTAGLNAKRLQMLHELVPTASRIGVLINPDNAAAGVADQITEVQEAAAALKCELTILKAHDPAEIGAAFAAAAKDELGALEIANDPYFLARRDQLVGLAAQYRIPAIYEWDEFVHAGGLASYGSSRADDYRTLGIYAGKILKGARPADLPVTQPTKFGLAVNLKTAKALGLTVPSFLLAQADEVIE